MSENFRPLLFLLPQAGYTRGPSPTLPPAPPRTSTTRLPTTTASRCGQQCDGPILNLAAGNISPPSAHGFMERVGLVQGGIQTPFFAFFLYFTDVCGTYFFLPEKILHFGQVSSLNPFFVNFLSCLDFLVNKLHNFEIRTFLNSNQYTSKYNCMLNFLSSGEFSAFYSRNVYILGSS